MDGQHVELARACVLAIGAHPDDAALSVGGLLIQLSDAGHQVIVLTLSSGELAGNAAVREAEEEEAMQRLGATVVFARLPDGHIAVRSAVEAMDVVVQQYDPAMVFVHAAEDTHQDHVTAFKAAVISCRNVPTLMTYESPSSVNFQPTITLDVTEYWDRKLHTLSAYVSQMGSRKLLEWVETVARYRAWPRHVGAFCEGLRLCHSRSLPALNIASVLATAVSRRGETFMFGFEREC